MIIGNVKVCYGRMCRKTGFSLVELLVVLSTVSLLTAMLMPALSRARQQTRAVICQSNLRQLYLANAGYATENDGFYVCAASDIWSPSGFGWGGGRYRWHGVRESRGVHPDPNKNMFDPLKGPLVSYLADGKVKECPKIVDFVQDGAKNAYEAGCGGYGYNSIGVGSRCYPYGSSCDEAMRSSMKNVEINQPGRKVMFTDAGSVEGFPQRYLIEYSFCEPPYDLDGWRTVPSIHFRHLGKTNVVWCDGHTSNEPFAFSTLEQEALEQFKIGWFGSDDNSLFRP